MFHRVLSVLAAFALLIIAGCSGTTAESDDATMSHEDLVKRGAYLVSFSGCNDCHSPKIMTDQGPRPDPSRLLSGQPANEPIPEFPRGMITPNGWMAATNSNMTAWAGPWGISFAANLTPDQVTGIGAWTEEAFINALHTGKHLGRGRAILPPMPWIDIGKMSDDDLKAVFAYLQSLKPIQNQVPQPIPPAGM
ncbi:MAG: c-type cytochrome [Candidatus Zixiibacteriota bacterium]